MVAKIVIGKSIRGILHYNEQKVAEGEAKLILASGFAGDIEKMSFHNKVQRFNHLTVLKPSVKTNVLLNGYSKILDKCIIKRTWVFLGVPFAQDVPFLKNYMI